jgi:signal transduction histidine kinase/CRP-like cAMP-binding protein
MYSLFDGLNSRETSELLKSAKEETMPSGTTVLKEGKVVERVYILKSGGVEIRKEIDEKEEVLGTIRTGDFFGELAVVKGKKNSASVVTTQDSTLLSFDREEFSAMIEKHPRISWNIARVLSDRLRASNDALKNQIEIQRMVSQKEIFKLNAVVEATQTVNTSLDIDRVLQLILQEAIRITLAERGTIYLLDENTNEIWARSIAGKEISEIRQPIGKGISGYVAQTGETVNITDAYNDDRFNPEFDKKSGFKTKNILCMPMRNKENKIIGVFQLINKRHGTFDFDSEDESFLKAFSVNAAIAIENSRLAQQMVQSERLSAVGRMAGTIVHDIKNPMSTIRIYAQVLKKKAGNEEAADLVDQIIKQIDRLVNMAQEVLDFSRGVSQLNLQPVNFEEFLSGVLLFLEKDFEKRKVELVVENSYKGKIEIDADKMTRVILNIGGNAGDAMPDGGKFYVRTYADQDNVKVELRDTGSGMPEEIRRKIFEPFVTFGKKHGTGLGMAIVKKIVDDHRGKIDIESELGKGTTMTLTIPIAQKK